MKEFFTLEGKIEENRKRLREILDSYKKIENYYPLFLGYVALIGVYSFDIFEYFFSLKNPQMIYLLGVLLTVHVALFSYSFYLFFKIIYLKPFSNDLLPKDVYSVVYSQIMEIEERNSSSNSNLTDEEYKTKIETKTNVEYLKSLEESLEQNYSHYESKKKVLSKLIKIISISVITYIFIITIFKFNVMAKTEQSNEPKKQQVEKPIERKRAQVGIESQTEKKVVIPKRVTNENLNTNKDKGTLNE